jgi:MFS family permease
VLAGAGFTASTAAMTLSRLVGDRVVDRFGPTATARAGALLAAAGITGGLLLSDVAGVVVGFGLVGLGIGSVFPLAFRAAGRLPGQPAGTAIAMVSLIARFGFLVAPPLVGTLAELASLRAALGMVAVAALVVAALSGRLDPA